MSMSQVHAERTQKTVVGEPEVLEDARGVEDSAAWLALKDAATALQAIQIKDGSVPDEKARAAELVSTITASIAELAPRFPHDEAYLAASIADFRRWADDGFGEPDFLDSLVAFHPEQHRVDGLRHLVVFPMYTQNGSSNRHVEALIVEVIWPEFVAALEAGDYGNKLFVSLRLIDFTPGYDTNSAVLFPETVAMREIPSFTWGAIFQDREAARYRRVVRAAAEITKLDLPADAAEMLDDQKLAEETFVMWDMIHDRTHMRGDLPFDPFMIRQRSPYWMYSLEELRCDLTAFGEAVKLEREGFAFARHAQYAILFDRLFRFPVTGSRVRNYDGLGGQLLFAFLHKEGYLHWTDNRLTIDWNRVAEGVERLRERVHDLYHSGIDRSKLGQWIAAHDLVAEYVAPAESSVWARERRDLPEVEEPKQLVDLVRDDEFPLSLFYTQLQPKLAPALARTRD
jgi:hypothetical protein